MNATWEDVARKRIDAVIDEIMAWGAGLSIDGKIPPAPAQVELLRRIYEEELPLARIKDHADLVVHAEGPGAAHDGPRLMALNWLSVTCERVMKGLASAWFDIKGSDGKRLVRHLDLRLAGMAPGSLWLGFRVEPVAADLLPQDAAMVEAIASRYGQLPETARYIGDEGIAPAIVEFMPDPAERDLMLESLKALSPTGKAGIHTVEVSSRAHGHSALTNRERVVLREALRRPIDKAMREASFAGEVRAADLDKTRITLRTADGAIRCVLPDMSAKEARALIGATARVTGRAACDREGRPRLLYVERIEPVAQQEL